MDKKIDTSGGFDPTLPIGEAITAPNRAALRMDGSLEHSHLGPQMHQTILTMARIKNVVSSLRQEGESIDFQSARDIIEGRKTAGPAEQEVLRLATEYATIHDTPADKLPAISIDFVRKLHGKIFAGRDVDDYHPGALKTEQNGVGPSGAPWIFECTPPDRTAAELSALFDWFSEAQNHDPAIGVASTFFAEFQAIHPFHDGNGRLGRLLNNLVLKKLGFQNIGLVPLDAHFFRSGETYYEKLGSTNQGRNWLTWGTYYARQLRRAYEGATKMGELQPLLSQQPTDSSRHVLAWALAGGGEWFKRSDIDQGKYQDGTLSVALRGLRDAGILEMVGDKKGAKYRLRTDLLQEIFRGIQ